MNEQTFIILIFAAVFFPVLFYSLIAIWNESKSVAEGGSKSKLDDFLLAGRHVQKGDFVNSSTGYMLQVSTTFYFIYWGYNYGFSNIFYVISWSLGIFLFSALASRLIRFREKFTTLPGLLSDNENGWLKRVAAFAAVLSFLGVFYVEAYFTADLISQSMGSGESAQQSVRPINWWIIFSAIAVCVAFYSSLGGLRKVYATDTWQLSCAYIGIAGIISLLLATSFSKVPLTASILALLSLAIYLVFLFTDRGLKDGKVKRFAVLISLAIIGVPILLNINNFTLSGGDVLIAGPFKQIVEPWGWFTLLGFVILNSLWQFADGSNFQRIASLELPEDRSSATIELRRSEPPRQPRRLFGLSHAAIAFSFSAAK
jgi:Na+/proline symporter